MAYVLAVDDEPDILIGLVDLLAQHGHEVKTANSGEEALEMLEDFKADAIVMDVVMPGIGGLEACRRIRANPDLAHIAIVLLSARSMDQDVSAGMDAGANRYLLKPFQILDVGPTINDLLERDNQSA